jgi:hypothetical protein
MNFQPLESQRMNGVLLASALLVVVCCRAGEPNANHVLVGRFDNNVQSDRSPADHHVPYVVIDIEGTPQPNWTLWAVHIETDAATSYDQTWAMHSETLNGVGALVPYYQLKQETPPSAATFDPTAWLSLEACAMRGKSGSRQMQGFSEGEPCVAVSMNIGARRALLPVAYEVDGNALHVDLNLRGERTAIVADRLP